MQGSKQRKVAYNPIIPAEYSLQQESAIYKDEDIQGASVHHLFLIYALIVSPIFN